MSKKALTERDICTQYITPALQASGWVAEHFDLLFDTPESIDVLKKSVLQLAVQGKLVPQDPHDKPASEILKRIKAEKTELVANGKLKQGKSLRFPVVGEEESSFGLPSGWEWTRLNEIFAVVTDGDHLPPPKADEGVPFLVIGNLNTGDINFDGCRYVPRSYFDALDWSRCPSKGDLLYTVTGSFGITIPVESNAPFCVQRHVAILKVVESSPRAFATLALRSKYAVQYAERTATGIAQKTVSLGVLRMMPIPVPPLAEQHRIVAKVDELMAVCDALAARLSAARELSATLAATVAEAATA